MYQTEELCRSTFENLFGKHFVKSRRWSAHNLELDGYCEEIQVAMEFQGIQHTKYFPLFHRNGEFDFIAQQQRDELKRKVCVEKGITLFEIPYQYSFTRPKQLEEYILECVQQHPKTKDLISIQGTQCGL